MAFFFFTVGTQNFPGTVKGYDDLRVYCPRCHNVSVVPEKERKFFTICFVPIIPIYWGKILRCTICPWRQETTEAALENMKKQQQGGPP
ncbi:hypothetical protein TRVA0_007S00628 [Trichomonascus vanleenenianus]|uniref:uncharacterized protein n=1 Tax=Trichomonascus vanleenenianus TaxID=2268995 RepID=UPI003EC96774